MTTYITGTQGLTSTTSGSYIYSNTDNFPFGGTTTSVGPSKDTRQTEAMMIEVRTKTSIASMIINKCANPKSKYGCWPTGECDHIELAAQILGVSVDEVKANLDSLRYGTVTIGATGTMGTTGPTTVTTTSYSSYQPHRMETVMHDVRNEVSRRAKERADANSSSNLHKRKIGKRVQNR